MKFLVMGDAKDVFFTLPPSMAIQLMETTNAVANQQKKAGKILEYYWVPGWGRVVAIVDNKTPEEMVQNMNDMPISGFMNYEVYPLADYNEAANIMLERYKAIAKMIPVPPK